MFAECRRSSRARIQPDAERRPRNKPKTLARLRKRSRAGKTRRRRRVRTVHNVLNALEANSLLQRSREAVWLFRRPFVRWRVSDFSRCLIVVLKIAAHVLSRACKIKIKKKTEKTQSVWETRRSFLFFVFRRDYSVAPTTVHGHLFVRTRALDDRRELCVRM